MPEKCATGQPHFTGKERDTETGLDYFGARYYGSNMGRFLSPDEFAGRAERPCMGPIPPMLARCPMLTLRILQSLNKYTYMYNNPLRYIDPDGHKVPNHSQIK